jgi:formamidopyrimidine-DNA glycosylase
MPELPEVETIARTLRPVLLNQTILRADLRWARTLARPAPADFVRQIAGQVIRAASRRGKYLLLQLSDFVLIFHLRMSGDLFVVTGPYEPAIHDRLVLTLLGESFLVFRDPRKFGRVWLTADPGSVLAKLGPEPLSEAFTPSWLFLALRERHRQLKPLLLDQTFLAGLGNIYTDEALHRAGLHPLRLSDTLSEAEALALWQSIRDVLEEGIRRNGASIDWVYRGGGFQNHFRVYRRTGQPCFVCGTPVERLLVGQRSSHVCPRCQPLSPVTGDRPWAAPKPRSRC